MVASVFTWIGFVCAISFMEAWLKFQAPGITLPIGLGVGRLVFNALNKVEWALAVAVYICFISNKQRVISLRNWQFMSVLIILFIQTFWLLPALDQRAVSIINGAVVPPSSLHINYIILEVIKVILLFLVGINAFRFYSTSAEIYRKQTRI